MARGSLMAQMSARGVSMAQMSAPRRAGGGPRLIEQGGGGGVPTLAPTHFPTVYCTDEANVELASSSKEAEVGPSIPRTRPLRFRREPAAPGRAGSCRLNAGCAASG